MFEMLLEGFIFIKQNVLLNTDIDKCYKVSGYECSKWGHLTETP